MYYCTLFFFINKRLDDITARRYNEHGATINGKRFALYPDFCSMASMEKEVIEYGKKRERV